MVDTQAGGKKNLTWLWALLAAVVLVAIVAWLMNRGYQKDNAVVTPDPSAQLDATGVESGAPAPPEPSAAAAALEGDAGGTSSRGVADASAVGGEDGTGTPAQSGAAQGTTPATGAQPAPQ